MRIYKIKHYISPIIFEHWTNLYKVVPYDECKERINAAYIQLTNEIESGIRENSIKVQAEISLLKHLMQ